MKRIVFILIKTILLFACVLTGIYLETEFYDARIKLIFPMMFISAVPVILCDLFSRRENRRGLTSCLSIMFAGPGSSLLYLVAVGVMELISLIWRIPNHVFYTVYTIILYILIVLWVLVKIVNKDIEDDAHKQGIDTVNEYGFISKTSSRSWLFLLEIHLAAKFLFLSETDLGFWKYVIIVLVSLLIMNLGPLRGDWRYLFDYIARKRAHISSKCSLCQSKFDLPIYLCPTCGRKYDDLMPGEDGSKYFPCPCGEKLPTTFSVGKGDLEALCPVCGANIKDGGRHVDICIPVIGGASSGKTCLIHQSIAAIERTAGANGLLYEPSLDADTDFDITLENLQKGYLPEKTNDMRLKYFQFHLTPDHLKLKHLISLCDIGGEVYSDSQALGEQIGFKHADAFLLVLDPLSIDEYRAEVARTVRPTDYGYSSDHADEIVGVLITTLENMFCMSSKEMLKTDIAVAFTKCDIPGLDARIGQKAVADYRSQNPSVSVMDAQNAVCEQFLTDYNEGNLLNTLRSKFRTVQFFAVSALGHNANSTPFVATGVEDPLYWLVDKASLSINLKDKWGKSI